jgi:N-acylneuraminate cytidylyltransferase
MATVAYVANPQYVMEAKSIFDGRVKSVLIPEERAVDIDTELDFQFAEYLMINRMQANEKN